MRRIFLSAILFPALVLCADAASLPNLRNQAAWGEKDKKEFLNYLKSSQPMPSGQVRKVAAAGSRTSGKPAKARYASLGLAADTFIIDQPGGGARTEMATPGPKLLFGGHLFSWVRYYAGLKYNRIGQDKLDGSRARLSHIEVPLGLELALIPLGTPHTRYVLLRGGVSSHRFSGPSDKADFAAPLLGWHTAWNLGLGYEWQFSNSRWRFHALAEACRSFSRTGRTPFDGMGLTAGFVYTF